MSKVLEEVETYVGKDRAWGWFNQLFNTPAEECLKAVRESAVNRIDYRKICEIISPSQSCNGYLQTVQRLVYSIAKSFRIEASSAPVIHSTQEPIGTFSPQYAYDRNYYPTTINLHCGIRETVDGEPVRVDLSVLVATLAYELYWVKMWLYGLEWARRNNLRSERDLPNIQGAFRRIPAGQYPKAALYFLNGEIFVTDLHETAHYRQILQAEADAVNYQVYTSVHYYWPRFASQPSAVPVF